MDDPLQEKIESDVVEIGPIQEEQFRKEGCMFNLSFFCT